jgi:hypothetical protein
LLGFIRGLTQKGQGTKAGAGSPCWLIARNLHAQCCGVNKLDFSSEYLSFNNVDNFFVFQASQKFQI